MLKYVMFLMVVAAACGADDPDDPHALVDCDPSIGEGHQCARACQMTTFQGELPACTGTWDGVEHACATSTELPDGEIGCCHFTEDHGEVVLQFMLCE